MELHHLKHNVKLWHLNHRLAKGISRKCASEQFGDFTFTVGSAKYLKEVQALHLALFRQPMLPWLVWVYRFHAPQLMSLVLDKEGRVAGYEGFMFNEAEVNDNYIHEVYVGVHESLQGQGLATALRRYSINSYNFGNLAGISTVAINNDIKALRSAQKAGYAIIKQSLKPSGHYLVYKLTTYH